jgi:hypothetical protein
MYINAATLGMPEVPERPDEWDDGSG